MLLGLGLGDGNDPGTTGAATGRESVRHAGFDVEGLLFRFGATATNPRPPTETICPGA
jgi:hypothetical protein